MILQWPCVLLFAQNTAYETGQMVGRVLGLAILVLVVWAVFKKIFD